MSQINVRGEGVQIALVVAGWESEQPRGESYDDNWLRGTATLEIAQPPSATFRAKYDVAWQTTDLLGFQEELGNLLNDLTGVATLSTLEDQVELTVRLTSGKGTIAGRLERTRLHHSRSKRRSTRAS